MYLKTFTAYMGGDLEKEIADTVSFLISSTSSPGSFNREKGVSISFAGVTGGRKVMPWAPHDDLLLKDDKAF